METLYIVAALMSGLILAMPVTTYWRYRDNGYSAKLSAVITVVILFGPVINMLASVMLFFFGKRGSEDE